LQLVYSSGELVARARTHHCALNAFRHWLASARNVARVRDAGHVLEGRVVIHRFRAVFAHWKRAAAGNALARTVHARLQARAHRCVGEEGKKKGYMFF
jgi:hypothetical protein